MCPACVAAIATIATGAASAGGITTFLVVTLRKKPGAPATSIHHSQGDDHDPAENRVGR
jgi:hypothetical protein